MGCGSRTAVPLVVADELDADWAKVKLQQAIGDKKYGDQDTDGSHSVRGFFDQMRVAGATARADASNRRRATVEGARVGVLHRAEHRRSQADGQEADYGQLATAAAKLPVPPKESVTLKKRSEWRYIGKETAMYDLADIVTGKAKFGMDAKVPGMVYASIEHPPVLGQKVSFLR